jgi:hypothetical protein
MDDETRAYLDAMQTVLLTKINDGHERILNRLASLERDFENTKGFLIGDALVAGRRWLDTDARVTKIERGGK